MGNNVNILSDSFCAKKNIEVSNIVTYKTFNTSLFKNHKLNRNVQPLKVKALVESFKKNYCKIPIIVRECSNNDGYIYEIMDGGHRFEAVVQYNNEVSEKIQLYFIIDNNVTVDDMREINNVGGNWKPEDFFESYLKEGRENFKETQQFMNMFPKLHLEACLSILALSAKKAYSCVKKMKRKGVIEIVDFEKSVKIATMVNDFINIDKIFCSGRDTLGAIIKFVSIKGYKHDRFIERLKNNKEILNMISYHNSVRGYGEDFHKAYNHRLKQSERLPIINVFMGERTDIPFEDVS